MFLAHVYGKLNISAVAGPGIAVDNMSDCRSRGQKFDPGSVPYFPEDYFDHEIVSTAILLPSTNSRKVFVSYK